MKIIYDPNSLCHYGILGMKWGKRKTKAKSSGKKTNKKNKQDKIRSDIRKQKIKNVAKTAAKIAGTVAVTSILGYTGALAMKEINDLNARNKRLSEALEESNARSIEWAQKAGAAEGKNIRNEAAADALYKSIKTVTDPKYSNVSADEKLNLLKEQALTVDYINMGGKRGIINEDVLLKKK